MALDGLVISNIVYELSETLTGGRINKIYQPEPDALILGIKNNRTNYKLLISASASLPLIYLTDDTPANPAVAPNFCMLLRKRITGGRLAGIRQEGLDQDPNDTNGFQQMIQHRPQTFLLAFVLCQYPGRCLVNILVAAAC